MSYDEALEVSWIANKARFLPEGWGDYRYVLSRLSHGVRVGEWDRVVDRDGNFIPAGGITPYRLR
jgi:hypothetical protein